MIETASLVIALEKDGRIKEDVMVCLRANGFQYFLAVPGVEPGASGIPKLCPL